MPNNFGEGWGGKAPYLLAILILVFGFRCYLTYRVFNDTADEAVHIACGLEVLEHRRYTFEAQHPPVARVLLALPAHLAGLRYREPAILWAESDRESYWRTLSMARLGNLVWAPFLIVYVYLWAGRLYGPRAGVGAALVASFCPNVMAHASLATLDFGAATAIFISSYHLWRWSREPGLGNCLRSAPAFAIAVLAKFSALLVLPGIAAVFFLAARWRQRPWHWVKALQRGALFVALVGLLIWGGYLFAIGPLGRPQFHPPENSLGHRLEQAAQEIAGRNSLPAPQFFRGILDVVGHNAEGHACYLLGRLGQFGWWYYFPVALAIKTTLPMLVLLVLWLVTGGWWSRGRSAVSGLYPLAAAAVVLGVAMGSNINLGVRHILVVYVFFAVIVSGLLAARRRSLRVAATLLVLWHVAESLGAHPDYLAYFNETVRGREEDFLLDSNLDWGQDLERLRRYLEENQVTAVYLSYFGRAEPARLGVRGIRALPPDLRPEGWVAVSQAHIAGLGLKSYNLGWLKAHTPRARIGKSILVYYFPPQERRD